MPGQGFAYDETGNIVQDSVSGSSRTFTFNGDNKQIEVKNSSGVSIGKYFYDGDGKRVKKIAGSETTIFVYDGMGKLVAEYSSTAPTSQTISYTATDPLGSPRVITDKTGNVISRRDFLPFGEELNANSTANRTEAAKYAFGSDNIRKRFTGYEKDQETGLDFAEARYYNNVHGRFTAVDPLLASGKSANPQTFNRYVYSLNSPLVMGDPSGMQAGWFGNGNRYLYSDDGNNFSDGSSTDGWNRVDFGINRYISYDCEGCAEGTQAYLYRYGGWDYGQRASQLNSREEPLFINFGLTGVSVPNPARAYDIWRGRYVGTHNFFAGIANLPVETPIVTPFPQTSLNSLFGTPRFVQYKEYENTGQKLMGFQTQALLTAGSFALGGGATGASRVTTTVRSSAIATMENAYAASGTVRSVAGYEAAGTFGRVGTSYNANIWGLFRTGESRSMFSFVGALENEARLSGATRLSIQGTHIVNPNFFNPAMAARANRLGFDFTRVNQHTIILSKSLF